MRKNTLMIAAAVAALTAGSTLAFAQQGAPDSKSNPASKSAPAEKMAPSAKPGGAEHAQTPGGERSTTGQGQMNERNKGGPANERSEERSKGGQAQERSKSKSETTGQAPNQAAPQANPKEGAKGNEQKNNKAEQRDRNRSTTGQGAPENREKGGGAMQNREQGGAMQNRENREQGGVQQNRTNEGRSGTSTSVEGRSSSQTNLTVEQRQKIHSVIIADRSAPRVEHVDFDVRVGTVVPRGKVKFVPLPSSIVEIQPAWRGYEYFLVGDEIVVVDPGTLHIVAVIPA